MVGGLAPILRTGHAAVFGNGTQAIDDPPRGEVGHQPTGEVGDRPHGCHKAGGDGGLHAHDAAGFGTAPLAAQCFEQRFHELDAGAAGGIAPELPLEGFAGHRVRRVQRYVGFLGTHLVFVMGEVTAAVALEGHKGRIPKEPLAHEVIGRLVVEQQAVGGLMAKDGHVGEDATRQRNGEGVRHRVVDTTHRPHKASGLGMNGHHGRNVAGIGDLSKLGPEFRRRTATGIEPIGGQHLREMFRFGHHGTGVPSKRRNHRHPNRVRRM